MSERLVLVVDDDKNVRETIRDVLFLEGIPVEAVEPGPEIEALLSKDRISLVVTDLNMPRMDGLELLSLVQSTEKTLGRTIPVFVVTGAGGEGRVQQALDKGAAGYFPKPFDLEEFLGAVQKALAEVAQ